MADVHKTGMTIELSAVVISLMLFYLFQITQLSAIAFGNLWLQAAIPCDVSGVEPDVATGSPCPPAADDPLTSAASAQCGIISRMYSFPLFLEMLVMLLP